MRARSAHELTARGGIFIVASSTIAPGARVLIRDAEWIVKRVDRTGI